MFANIFQKYIIPKNIIFFVILVLFLVFIFKIPDIVLMFFASFVLANSLNPIVDKIENMCNKNRSLAATIVMLSVLFLFFVTFVPIIIISGHEIKSFAVNFPQYIDSIDEKLFNNFPFLKDIFLNPIDADRLFENLSNYTSQYLDNVVDIGKNVGTAIIYMIISVMLIFYFIADRDMIKDTCMHLFPSQMRKRANEIYDIISHRIGGYVLAQILTMLSVGIVMIIGLTIIGVKYAPLLALIATVFDIVPVVGPGVALVICCVTTYDLGVKTFIGVIIIFSLAQIIENQVVRPYVFGKLMKIHPIIVILFLFIAAKFLGFIGVIFAPAIAATICVLIKELYMKSLN